ncbi:CapA family protein [Akkermansiaceae bacterium]|nr:CapA family protein [Akkermansiaceae bacterium]
MVYDDLVFSGDFVCPNPVICSNAIQRLDSSFLKAPKIINFETSLRGFAGRKRTRGVALLSEMKSLEVLNKLNVVCVTMANNHVTDYEIDIDKQKELLLSHNIQSIGVGNNLIEAAKPFICDKRKIVLLTFGWDVIRCKYSTSVSLGINPYIYKYVEEEVLKYRRAFPEHKLVVTIHGNYEFERYPQPADREFAHYLIDLGVDAIIGHHPHIISGCEQVQGKPIFYSLGNFYTPEVEYDGYKLSFHKEARVGLSVKLGGCIQDVEVFLHKQSASGDSMSLTSRGKMLDSDYLSALSGFRGMSHKDYLLFYKEHKFHKNKLLPTFRSFRNTRENSLKSQFVKIRQIPIDLRSKIKGRDSR